MKVRIGMAPTTLPAGKEGADLFWRTMDLCDTLDFDSVWLSDRPVGPRISMEPMVGMAAVAGRYPKLKFGTSVLILSIRQPVLLAKELATFDYLSGGRIFPAIGLGQDDPREYEAMGTRKEERGRRVDEAIPLLRRLWTEDNVTHHGEFYTLNDVTVEPKPLQKPSIPLWIGGRSTAAQRRIGRLGDGWLCSSATAAEMEEGIRVINATAIEAERSVPEDHMGANIGFRIDTNKDVAVEKASPFAVRLRPDADFASYAALGTSEDVVSTLRDYVAAGVTKFVLRPMCLPEEMEEQLRRAGEDVLPVFHPARAGAKITA